MSIARFLPAVLIVGTALPAMAEQRQLTKAEILTLLPTITAYGKSSVQTFEKNGITDYNDKGRDSRGNWQVRGNQYCSVWPPSPTWVCYDVLVDDEEPDKLVWIGDSGNPIIDRMEPRESD